MKLFGVLMLGVVALMIGVGCVVAEAQTNVDGPTPVAIATVTPGPTSTPDTTPVPDLPEVNDRTGCFWVNYTQNYSDGALYHAMLGEMAIQRPTAVRSLILSDDGYSTAGYTYPVGYNAGFPGRVMKAHYQGSDGYKSYQVDYGNVVYDTMLRFATPVYQPAGYHFSYPVASPVWSSVNRFVGGDFIYIFARLRGDATGIIDPPLSKHCWHLRLVESD